MEHQIKKFPALFAAMFAYHVLRDTHASSWYVAMFLYGIIVFGTLNACGFVEWATQISGAIAQGLSTGIAALIIAFPKKHDQ